jgi:hypothetical protein
LSVGLNINMKDTDKRLEDPRIKGDIAEKLFELECIKRGIELFIPSTAGGRIDYVTYTNNTFQKVQIKYISSYNNTIQISFTKPQNGRRDQDGKPIYKKYSSDEIDLFLVYCPDTNQWYNIPMSIADKQRGISLRLSNEPPKNNNMAMANFASEYIW